MSKERAERRAAREVERERASVERRRRELKLRRSAARKDRIRRPGRAAARASRRGWTWWSARSRGQRVVVALATLVMAVGLVRAPTWGLKVLVVGFTALMLPVAWTLVTDRRG